MNISAMTQSIVAAADTRRRGPSRASRRASSRRRSRVRSTRYPKSAGSTPMSGGARSRGGISTSWESGASRYSWIARLIMSYWPGKTTRVRRDGVLDRDERASRRLGLHPRLVPEAVKLTNLTLLRDPSAVSTRARTFGLPPRKLRPSFDCRPRQIRTGLPMSRPSSFLRTNNSHRCLQNFRGL